MKIEYSTILFTMVVSLSDFYSLFGELAAKTTVHTNKQCLGLIRVADATHKQEQQHVQKTFTYFITSTGV